MKYIKRFEESYFHSMDNIDEILDKINEVGYKNLDESDRAILLNYSRDDGDIYAILVRMNRLIERYKRFHEKMSVLVPSDEELIEDMKIEFEFINSELSKYERKLRELYKIENPKDVFDYMDKSGIIKK